MRGAPPPPARGPRRRFGPALGLAFLALTGACAPGRSPVTLATTGGDAWTFDKVVEAALAPDACDTVAFASPAATVLARPSGGHAIARLPLLPGDNPVEVECRKDGWPRGAAAGQHWLVRLTDAPKAWIRAVPEDGGLALDAGGSEMAPARPSAIAAYEWRTRPGNPAPIAGLPARGRQVALAAPPVDGDYEVTLRVTDGLGRSDESSLAFRVRGGEAMPIDPLRGHPAWIDGAVVYGVVPFFFGPHQGLADVAARLDALAALGVTVLWLSPVTAAPADDFGYATTDYFALRRSFGSDSDLRRLVEAAHARGLRVILDFVPNHLSSLHPYIADALARGRASPYYDYVARDPTGAPAHYFDWDNLINLNYDDPEVQRLVIEAFAYWVRSFDIDGFRVDSAWGPRLRAPEFWPRWRRELKRIKPDLLLIAEAPACDPYYLAHGFDAAYDWTDQLGEWAWRGAFEDPAHAARRLRQAIAACPSGRIAGEPVFRFLDNNDTGARFVARYGVGWMRVASAMLLTLPGLPGLYTGEEDGARYEPYALGPPIAWQDPGPFGPWLARLIALRRSEPALRSPRLSFIDVAPADEVLAYLRPGERRAGDILVLLNYGRDPVRARFPPRDPALPGTGFIDLLTGESIAVDPRRPSVALPAYGVRVLKLRG